MVMVTILPGPSERYRYRAERGTQVRLEYAAALRDLRSQGLLGRRMARVLNRWVNDTSNSAAEEAAVEFLASRGIGIPGEFLDS